MKKIISKLALVGVAVAALFTSCVVEDIQTTFDLADAVCTVNVKVLYALDQSDVTGQATISHKYGSASTFTVPATNKTVNAEDIAITASFKGLSETQTVHVATLLPGGLAQYSALFVFGSEGDITYESRLVSQESEDETLWLTNSHYSHGGEGNWLYNESEFILTGTVDYEIWSGSKLLSVDPATDANVKAFADAIEANDPVTKTPGSLDLKISAWAAYRAWQTRTATTFVYDVYKVNTLLGTETKLGTFSFLKYSGNAAQWEEKAISNHAGHYQKGHGTVDTHGGHNNAGGGIIFGE